VTSPPASLRILVNAVHSKSGGGLTYLRNVLPLLARGMDVHVAIQADQEADIRPVCEEGGLTLHVLPVRGKLTTVLVQEQLSVPLLARRIGAEVVFSPANYGPILGPPAVILLRNAFEVTELDPRLAKRLYWWAVKRLTWACFKTCRRAMVVSAHAGQTFLRVFGLPDDARLSVVHHGIGPIFHPPETDAARIPGRLLAVSDVYVQKNFETLLRAMARLVPGHPELRLDIAGRELDPDYAASLRGLAAGLGLAGRVAFLGGQSPERVAELYRQASVFVFPSLVETFGNPLVEAMASGIPVVCSDAAAMPEVTGGAALLARPRDDAHLAEQIGRLLNDAGLRRDLAARGLARAACFSWERTAEQVAAVLGEAAKD
jgi:glycosyltransferase involved in cell wall biosynthesis